ncbi:DUF6461 domain-containing protein [Streptomyces sp. WI04-05B]|uniref:DUF6461 domain-containing protein n=1 Tax=Streptomyces TaxID=1883 RepID=UPI0029B6B67D|nr:MULTISPECIES: DUF6461 domain-containing protein [unclassified Streptomyces]MDX2546914.1 DUF6461 domain-containing protein [Streptomyces sp. WI04-05B]MDX2589299.1 DUF6461 domain-containing protein [Streptomyces sp. WI04-05A]
MNASIFPNSQLYETGYCALFVKEISPAELLSRVSGREIRPIPLNRLEADAVKAFGEDIDEGDVPGLNVDDLHSSGILDNSGPLLRAGAHGDWSFVIESEGPYLARDEILQSVSHGTVALSTRLSETGSTWISYAEDGEILSSFDPLFPQHDYGKNPATLEELTAYREAIDSGDRSESHVNAIRKIQQELRCTVPQEADATSLLAVRIAGGY